MSALEIPEPAEVVPSLDERASNIIGILNGAAHDIGQELLDAKREHPREFMAWVDRNLPFGIDKAEKLMAIKRAWDVSPPEVRAALPAPWTVAFELSRLSPERRIIAVETGEIRPGLTVAQARELVTGETEAPTPQRRTGTPGPEPGFDPNPRLTTDIIVRELLRTPREDLSLSMETLLREWLNPKEIRDGS